MQDLDSGASAETRYSQLPGSNNGG